MAINRVDSYIIAQSTLLSLGTTLISPGSPINRPVIWSFVPKRQRKHLAYGFGSYRLMLSRIFGEITFVMHLVLDGNKRKLIPCVSCAGIIFASYCFLTIKISRFIAVKLKVSNKPRPCCSFGIFCLLFPRSVFRIYFLI